MGGLGAAFVEASTAITASGAILVAASNALENIIPGYLASPSSSLDSTAVDTPPPEGRNLGVVPLTDSHFLMVWEQGDPGSRSIAWARRSATGWYPQNPPLGDSGSDFHAPELFTNGDGAAYLIWSDGSAGSTMASYDLAADSWTTLTGHPTLTQASEVQVTVLDNGDAFVLTVSGNAVEAHKYDLASDSWTDPADPQLAGSGAPTTLLAGNDDDGNLFLVYVQNKATSGAALWGTRYEAATDSWSEPVVVHDGIVNNQDLEVIPNGTAMLAWTTAGQERPFVARFE
jgi:hypothetical protein